MKEWLILGIKKRNKEIKDTWDQLAQKTNFKDGEQYRLWVKDQVLRSKPINKQDDAQKDIIEKASKEREISINQDGSQSSYKVLAMTESELGDPTQLLIKHGYSVTAWEVFDSESKIWGVYSTQDGIQTLYSSRLRVKPIASGWDMSELIKSIDNLKPLAIKHGNVSIADTDYLEIPLFDMHWGNNYLDYYKPTQFKIKNKLKRRYKEVLFVVGSDLLHNDNFRGTTSKGTPIDKVDMVRAWNDALTFYTTLINRALESKSKVTIYYKRGNHDESMSWAFVQTLKALFPQAKINDKFQERKVHMLGTNFIGFNHGDKKREDNLTENFATEFPLEWSKATTRQIHTGHRHSERVIDKGGVILRRLPTANQIDQWHDDGGYTTAHKRFEIFEYSEHALETITYV